MSLLLLDVQLILQCHLFPVKGATNVSFVTDSRRQITMTVVVPMGPGPMVAQMTWKGKTTAVVPAATPENMLSSYSESRWSTAEILHDVLDFAGRKLGGEPLHFHPWLCANPHFDILHWDVEREVALDSSGLRRAKPHSVLSTAWCGVQQTTEGGYQNTVPEIMAREVLAQDLVGPTPTIDTRLTSLRQPLTTWVSEALVALQDRDTIKGKA